MGVFDPEGYGDIVYFGTTGTFAAGDLVYLDNTSTWNQADASTTATSINMLAIALGATVAQGLLVRGYVYNSNWNFTSGVPLYVSLTAGGITQTAPSTTGEAVRIVGYCTDSSGKNKIYFNPDNSWIEL